MEFIPGGWVPWYGICLDGSYSSRGFVWVLGAISLNTVVELYPFPRCVLGGDGYVSVTLVKHCLGFVVQFLDRLVSVCLMFYCL